MLVTGATGFLGRHLLVALRAAGVPASALVRSRASWPYRGDEVGDVTIVDGDPLSDAWRAAAPPVRTIIHAAGMVRHSRRDAGEMMHFNVEGTLQILRAAQAMSARVVLISSSGTVGCFRSAAWVADEKAPYVDATVGRWPYYVSKLRAEREGRALADTLGVDLRIVRLPVLLGPGDHRLRSTGHVTRVLTGRVPFIPSGGIAFSDIRDVATAVVRLATAAAPEHGVYHFPGTAASLAEFFRQVSDLSGVPLTRRRAPAWLLRAIAFATRAIPLHALPDPVVLEMANHHWGCGSRWSHGELGYASRPARDTLVDTIAWLRAHHPELATPAALADRAIGSPPPAR